MTREQTIKVLNMVEAHGLADEAKRMAIKALKQEPRWIPVSETLPEKYCYTLWCASSGEIRTDFFNGEYWEDAKKYGYQVVAWMPLPEPFKAESEDKE